LLREIPDPGNGRGFFIPTIDWFSQLSGHWRAKNFVILRRESYIIRHLPHGRETEDFHVR
jgi:hypothetical protein